MGDGPSGSGYDYQVCDHCRSRKIRCGREKPSCTNCTRIGQACEWSGQGKKGNQVAQLPCSSNIVLALESRIDKLEKQWENEGSMKRLSPNSAHHTLVSKEPNAFGELSIPTPSSAFPAAAPPEPLRRRPAGRFLTTQGDALRGTYFGPTSLETGMLDFKDFINHHQGGDKGGLRGISASIEKRIDAFVRDGQFESMKTGTTSLGPPTGPPLAILDAMIESYFATLNPRFPIWRKSSFKRLVSSYQKSSAPNKDWVPIVCCNNIILVTLSANSMCHAQQRSTATESNEGTSSIDFDLITGFLTNAKRAIGNVQLLLGPRLNNVQALLSLCVIAQEYLSINVLEAVFALTVQCAKASGIYHWQSFQTQLNEEDIQEFQNVSLCLKLLHTEIGWASGSFLNISISEMPLEYASVSGSLSDLALRAELSAIEQSVFLEAYTSSHQYGPPNEPQRTRLSTSERLDDWLRRCNLNLNDFKTKPGSSPGQAELVARYFCVKLLIVWPYRDRAEGISTECADIARSCMAHLLRMWSSAMELGLNMAVPMIISSYPPLYLYAITTVILEGRGRRADKDSLCNFANMIDAIAGCREEKAYRSRLKEMTHILVEAVEATDSPRKRRKTLQSDTSRLSDHLSPRSYGHAAPTTTSKRPKSLGDHENEFVSLDCWGQDHQNFDSSGFDGLDLQNWEDPFTLVSSTAGSSVNIDLSPDSVVGFSNMMEN